MPDDEKMHIPQPLTEGKVRANKKVPSSNKRPTKPPPPLRKKKQIKVIHIMNCSQCLYLNEGSRCCVHYANGSNGMSKPVGEYISKGEFPDWCPLEHYYG